MVVSVRNALALALAVALALAAAGCTGTVIGTDDAVVTDPDDGVFEDALLDRMLPPGPSTVEVELEGSESRGFAVLLSVAGATERVDVESSNAAFVSTDESNDATTWDIEVPAQCQQKRATHWLYKHAFVAGFYFIKKLSRRLRSCDLVDRFVDRVATLLGRIAETIPAVDEKPFKHCVLTGLVDGGAARVEKVFEKCTDKCFAAGEQIGESRAGNFCEAAEQDGTAPDPGPHARGLINSCGLTYQIACDAAYLGRSTEGTCEPFTRGDSADAWDRSRLLDCDYSQRPAKILP